MSSNKIIYTGKREGSQTYRSYILMGKLYAAMLKEYFGIFLPLVLSLVFGDGGNTLSYLNQMVNNLV